LTKFATVNVGGEIFSLTLKPLESLENFIKPEKQA